MNKEFVEAGVQVFLASLEFMRQLRNDNGALQVLVDKARAEGRELDLTDVKEAVGRMHSEGDTLRELIASKKAETGTAEGT